MVAPPEDFVHLGGVMTAGRNAGVPQESEAKAAHRERLSEWLNQALQGVEEAAEPWRVGLGARTGPQSTGTRSDASPTPSDDRSRPARKPGRDEGALMVHHVATSTSVGVGDGRATAVVLAAGLFRESAHRIAAGHDAEAIQRGIERAVAAVEEVLNRQARPVTNVEDLRRVAMAAVHGDEALAHCVSEALAKVGPQASVEVERHSSGASFTLTLLPSMEVKSRYISHHFRRHDWEGAKEFLHHPLILVVDGEISWQEEVESILAGLGVESRRQSLLIIARGVTDEALATLVTLKLRHTLNVCAVQSSGGERLDDIVKVTGGRVVHDLRPDASETLKLEDFGRARRVVVEKGSTFIDGGAGAPEEVTEHLQRLFRMRVDGDFEHQALQKRVKRLSTHRMAVLGVGAATEAEQESRIGHALHALRALREALDGGSVPGGGLALFRCRPALDALHTEGDEGLGVAAVRRALEEPLRQLATNYGHDVASAVLDADTREDARASGAVGGFLAEGVADALRVVREALKRAASGALSLLRQARSQVPIAHDSRRLTRFSRRLSHLDMERIVCNFAAPPRPDDSDEGSAISRYPSIDTVAPLRAGEHAMFLVDLLLEPSGTSAFKPYFFSGLDERWATLHVRVELQSAELDFSRRPSSGGSPWATRCATSAGNWASSTVPAWPSCTTVT